MDTQASMESFNAGDSLLRDVWGVVSVSLLAVILRVFAKLRTNQFRPDDIIMSAAQVISNCVKIFDEMYKPLLKMSDSSYSSLVQPASQLAWKKDSAITSGISLDPLFQK